jgi:uncharacterized membrane protein
VDKTTVLGRYLFAISMAAFGIQQFICSDFVPGLMPLPAWNPGRLLLIYVIGFGLVAAGASIVANKGARFAATLLGLMWSLCVLVLHVPRLAANPHNGSMWAGAFEVVAIGGAAFILAGTLAVEDPHLHKTGALSKTIAPARYAFAISLLVFGIQHFIYYEYVSSVIPSWIPGHLFWAYLTGVAHIAAGLSIATKVKARLAATLLGLMFGLWFLLLHIPRAVAHLHEKNEWGSAIVALAMCGGSLLIAGSLGANTRD